MLIRSGASWDQCDYSPTIRLAVVLERLRADLLICPLLAAKGVPTLALCCSRSGSVSVRRDGMCTTALRCEGRIDGWIGN